jgi:hypothetical protein
MVQILWLNMSMVLCFYRLWIQILEMFNKSLPHIIFNKWTFIDLMSNLITLCTTLRVKSWNSIHTMNSSTLIPWDSSNNVFTLLIKFRFTISYSYSHKYTCYCWFYPSSKLNMWVYIFNLLFFSPRISL